MRTDAIDIYHGNGRQDWARWMADGVVCGIAKISEGTYFDPLFDQNRADMEAAGIELRGAYHWLRANNARTQAQFMLDRFGRAPGPGEFFALDWEWPTGSAPAPTADDVHSFMDELVHFIGPGRCLLYAPPMWWKQMGSDPTLGDYPCWRADPPPPTQVNGWPWDGREVLWQWGDPNGVDVNEICDLAALRRIAGLEDEVPPYIAHDSTGQAWKLDGMCRKLLTDVQADKLRFIGTKDIGPMDDDVLATCSILP